MQLKGTDLNNARENKQLFGPKAAGVIGTPTATPIHCLSVY